MSVAATQDGRSRTIAQTFEQMQLPPSPRRKAGERPPPEQRKALMERHTHAIRHIAEADDVSMRWRMLAMVVCPEAVDFGEPA